MEFLCIACIVLSSIALHGIALHRIAWHCMVLQRLHGVVQIIWRAGELPRSASSHFVSDISGSIGTSIYTSIPHYILSIRTRSVGISEPMHQGCQWALSRYLIPQSTMQLQWALGWCPGKSSFLALSWYSTVISKTSG